MISYVGIRIDVDFIGFFVRCSLSQFFPSIQTGRPFPTKQMYNIALAKHELGRNSWPVCSLNWLIIESSKSISPMSFSRNLL